MKLDELIVGKTIESVSYLSHEVVMLSFTDASHLRIHQPSQAGALYVHYLDNVAHEVNADDERED